nr:hypothetical protein [Tanacetum cinerariifolium]
MIDTEYEWQPSRCDKCKNFDHKDEQCPKKVKVDAPTKVSNDGFIEASTSQSKERKEPFAPHPKNKGKNVSDLQEINILSLQNMFDAVMEKDKILRKPMDGLADDARKKVDAPPKKVPMKIGCVAFV